MLEVLHCYTVVEHVLAVVVSFAEAEMAAMVELELVAVAVPMMVGLGMMVETFAELEALAAELLYLQSL